MWQHWSIVAVLYHNNRLELNSSCCLAPGRVSSLGLMISKFPSGSWYSLAVKILIVRVWWRHYNIAKSGAVRGEEPSLCLERTVAALWDKLELGGGREDLDSWKGWEDEWKADWIVKGHVYCASKVKILPMSEKSFWRFLRDVGFWLKLYFALCIPLSPTTVN